MPKSFSIALNTSRCLYKEPGRTYFISQEDGHRYDGPDALITVTEVNVTFDNTMGTMLGFPRYAMDLLFVRGSTGHDDLALTSLSLEAKCPDPVQPIAYRWPALDGLSLQLSPVEGI